MEESTLVQARIDKLWMIVNIDHQVFNEDLAFTFLEILPSFFHTLVVSLSTHINQFFMELVSKQLLQEKL